MKLITFWVSFNFAKECEFFKIRIQNSEVTEGNFMETDVIIIISA